MYDYPGIEKGDLPLCKGQKVIIFDDSRDHWWRARDDKGYVHALYMENFVPVIFLLFYNTIKFTIIIIIGMKDLFLVIM